VLGPDAMVYGSYPLLEVGTGRSREKACKESQSGRIANCHHRHEGTDLCFGKASAKLSRRLQRRPSSDDVIYQHNLIGKRLGDAPLNANCRNMFLGFGLSAGGSMRLFSRVFSNKPRGHLFSEALFD